MRDDFLTRDWAENRQQFFRDFHKLAETISVGLQRGNAYQFDAPWRAKKCS